MDDEIFLNIVKEKNQLRAKRFESFFSKYTNYTDEDTDEIDLQTMTIVKNNGHVQNLKARFGNSNLASSTIIKKYMAQLEEEKRKDASSMSSMSYTPRKRSKRQAWREDESKENEFSDIHHSDPKESMLFNNVLQSFQSCAENMFHDFFDVRGQNLKIDKARRGEMSFGEGNYSLKDSLLYGNKKWDITLQVSVKDITCSQKDFHTFSPLEPISKDVFRTGKNASVLVNLLNLMRIKSSHISRTPVMPLKMNHRSKAPMCDIIALKGKDDADCTKEELCSPQKSQSKNLRAITYSPVSSTSILLGVSTTSLKQDTCYSKEKLCSIQKIQSKNLPAIKCSPEISTSILCGTINSSGRNDDSHAKELGSIQKLESPNPKSVMNPIISSTPIHLNASGEPSIQKTKKVCNKEESNVLESNANIPGKQLDTDTEDTCSTEEIGSLEKTAVCDLFNKESMKYSPMTFKPTRLNPLTPSRKRCFIDDDDEKSIQKTIKAPQKKENNVPKSSAIIAERESETGTKVTCSTVESSNGGQTPVCDLLSKKYVKCFPSSLTPVHWDARKYQKIKTVCNKREGKVLESSANITGTESNSVTELTCSTEKMSSCAETPVCDLLLCLNKLHCRSTPIKTSARSSLKRKCTSEVNTPCSK